MLTMFLLCNTIFSPLYSLNFVYLQTLYKTYCMLCEGCTYVCVCVCVLCVCVCVNVRRASQLVIVRAATQTDPVPGPNISQVRGPREEE